MYDFTWKPTSIMIIVFYKAEHNDKIGVLNWITTERQNAKVSGNLIPAESLVSLEELLKLHGL